MTRIAIYSQEPVLAHGLISIIPTDFLALGVFSSIEELKEQCLTFSPDLLVVDIDPGVNLEVLRDLATALPGAGIVVWVDAIKAEFASQCLAVGVRGVLSKFGPLETHLRCLTALAAGSVWIDPAVSNSLFGTKQVRLTPRERQLMGLLTQGLRNKEIAWALGITEGTVKVYLTKLFFKVGATDRLELALLAMKNLPNPSAMPESPSAQPYDLQRPIAFPASIHLALKARPSRTYTAPMFLPAIAGSFDTQRKQA